MDRGKALHRQRADKGGGGKMKTRPYILGVAGLGFAGLIVAWTIEGMVNFYFGCIGAPISCGLGLLNLYSSIQK